VKANTRGRVRHVDVRYADGDALLFGCETAGLPGEVLDAVPEARRLRLPMQPNSRSLNLSNTVAVAVYEAWRQLGFEGATA
ncbi:tRNA (cytidine(34)-2'-O)-methyltransferase, partial [Staphylococcus aureus]|uniref:tRNA (cytidine(34)-2'-O)-methyltransferase n=1 Tax=Staphylococcus aureus TaxID=1280 RepID=UPI0039BEABE2